MPKSTSYTLKYESQRASLYPHDVTSQTTRSSSLTLQITSTSMEHNSPSHQTFFHFYSLQGNFYHSCQWVIWPDDIAIKTIGAKIWSWGEWSEGMLEGNSVFPLGAIFRCEIKVLVKALCCRGDWVHSKVILYHGSGVSLAPTVCAYV